jgi:hypothetical protein
MTEKRRDRNREVSKKDGKTEKKDRIKRDTEGMKK